LCSLGDSWYPIPTYGFLRIESSEGETEVEKKEELALVIGKVHGRCDPSRASRCHHVELPGNLHSGEVTCNFSVCVIGRLLRWCYDYCVFGIMPVIILCHGAKER
jgi:hypothetical protein